MPASNGMDNILSGILGTLEGAQRAYQPFAQQQLSNIAQKQQIGNQLDYESRLLPMQNQNEMSLFKQKLPLKEESEIRIEQSKKDPTDIYGANGDFIRTTPNKVVHLNFPPGTGSHVDTRKIGEIRQAGGMNTLPQEIQNDTQFDSYTIPEYNSYLKGKQISDVRTQANDISAGKTGIFQGLRNNMFGVPGQNKKSSVADSILKKHGIQ